LRFERLLEREIGEGEAGPVLISLLIVESFGFLMALVGLQRVSS
jgi:hypothetical protein